MTKTTISIAMELSAEVDGELTDDSFRVTEVRVTGQEATVLFSPIPDDREKMHPMAVAATMMALQSCAKPLQAKLDGAPEGDNVKTELARPKGVEVV